MSRRLVETVTGPKGTARIRRDVEWDEWTVDVDGQGEESRYHTDDKGDAQSHADTVTGSTARPVWEVIVGNVGIVMTTRIESRARMEYRAWVRISKGEFSRATGEQVTLMCAGDIVRDHAGADE